MKNYKDLIKLLSVIGHPVVKALKSPVEREEYSRLCAENNLILPPYIEEHFNVHDGINFQGKMIGEISIFPEAIPISLEKAFHIFRENLKNKWWPIYFFPLFESGGDYFCIDLYPENHVNKIYYYQPSSVEFDRYISIFDNYQSMINTVYDCYVKKIYYLENGILDVNDNYEIKNNKLLNPQSEYWKIWQVED